MINLNVNMKKSIIFLAVSAALLWGCNDDSMDVKFTQKGPQMEILSCDETAFMGDSIRFSVSLNDDFPLSTLKADLYYDETGVSNVTIRTKEDGTYSAAISSPIFADISDGTASLIFTARNTGLGITKDTVEVAVSRPDCEYLTLVLEGKEYKMTKVGDYLYEVTGNFPAAASALIKTPSLDASGHVVTFGWDGSSALKVGSSVKIPFSAAKAGVYKISVDLKTLTAAPFGTITCNVSEASKTEVLNLLQGTTVAFPNIADITDWNMDYDFFKVNEDNTITFKPIDGLYKFTADFDKSFIKVEAMADADNYSTFDSGSAEGAIWAIGGNFGKPKIGDSWNTDTGAYCLSEISDKVYQLTLTAGESLGVSGYSIKFFHQKGWGGEFGSFATVNGAGLIKVTNSGNIEPAEDVKLDLGQAYTFTIDVTKGFGAASLSIVKTDIPVSSLDIHVNGVKAARVSSTHYQVQSIDIEKGQALNIEGVTDLTSWFLDPDYLYIDGSSLKFNAVSGKFAIDLYLDGGYATFRRLKSNGEEATIDEGALWMMAWGLANPTMKDGQLAFNPGAAFCLAEIKPMVFQFTGIAVEETDATTVGGRIRYDYLSFKYFGQDGWGRECGKIIDEKVANTVKLTNLAATYLNVSDSHNIELKDAVGQPLEKGATYVLTIDLSKTATDKIEVIDLIKK